MRTEALTKVASAALSEILKLYEKQVERGRMDIADWRKKIDELDEEIVRLLSERAAAAVAIGQLKRKDAGAIYEPQREQAVFDHVKRVNPGPMSAVQLQDLYERIMDVMRALQRPANPGDVSGPAK
jgi:chorismate mutase